MRPVIIELSPGARQLGLMVEHHPDGSGTVFFPESPNPSSGPVLIVEASLMRELRIPARKVFKCFSLWGQGTAKVLEQAYVAKREMNQDE